MKQPLASRGALSALAHKYRCMAALRASGASDATSADRAALRALAKEFPGALRELDTLATEEITARAAACERAGEGGAIEPWMAWLVAYHALMRAALVAKAELSSRRRRRSFSSTDALDDAAVEAILDRAERLGGERLDAPFVRDLATPPDGRLSVLVFARLGARFSEPPSAIWDALFPPRRHGRY